MTKTKTPTKTPQATRLNVFVLGRVAAGRREFPNQIEWADAPHMIRCMKAGLVAVCAHDVSLLRVTEAGRQAIGDAHVHGVNVALIPEASS